MQRQPRQPLWTTEPSGWRSDERRSNGPNQVSRREAIPSRLSYLGAPTSDRGCRARSPILPPYSRPPASSNPPAGLADAARDSSWSHEEYLAAVLERQLAARDRSGGRLRLRAAGFGTVKTLEDFDFDAQPAVRTQIVAPASEGSLSEARSVVHLGPSGTGKTHLATALDVTAARHGHRVLSATATAWGRPHIRRPCHRPAGRRALPAPALRADHRRRGRLPALRTRRRQPGLPSSHPLRTRLSHPHFQPALLGLRRRLRGPGRRDTHDRPPLRRPHPRRRQPPPTRPRPRQPPLHPHHHTHRPQHPESVPTTVHL